MILNHRGYEIKNSGRKYVAKHQDGDELEIHSSQMSRLKTAIDQIWNTTSQVTCTSAGIDELVAPRWLREWMRNPTDSIDLDAAYRRGAC